MGELVLQELFHKHISFSLVASRSQSILIVHNLNPPCFVFVYFNLPLASLPQ